VRVGSGSIIGAGAVVREGMHVPANSLVLGVPGRVMRETTMQERDRISRTVINYVQMQERYRSEARRP
jgi:carbonic anhydrase/acetyltransferase-like protein (isoleucine patch superfamily)